ncbi:hypothetical protein CWE15_05730 [Aliidiomarina taiwanensis]|uniref:Type II secretion system protein GspF domain-containing protein n=1 Tax=Aliidiomarina taiwanensis TaxID=946228 RepID=A0A432X7U0_9GAMM|nr:type II secretion system F family protein [Aliidiomarina taiwanensis]RUO42900.1 hypothetical protein CWE15_05730 [Aliidiomarina taiwanensis]
MKLTWYYWQGHHLHDTHQVYTGVQQARHPHSVAFQLIQRHIRARKVKPLPKLGPSRQARTRFWAHWLTRWHALLDSGFDLAQSLQQLIQQSRFQEEASLCHACLLALQQGKPLAPLFQQPPLPLPSRSHHLLAFAEQAGQLDVMVQQLSETAQQSYEQTKVLRQALLYPVAVLFMVAILGAGLKLFILPKFAALYASTAAELPALTRFLLSPSATISGGRLVLAGACLVTLLFITRLWLGPALRWHPLRQWLGRVPLWYSWYERPLVQQDIHALALAMQHGMTLQQALLSVAHTHHCTFRQALWLQGLQALQAGQGSRAIFAGQGLTPAEQALIQVGEQTGRLDTKLFYIAQQQQQAISRRRANLLALLPNIILILVSIVTAAVMIALYLPLFQLGLAVA